ncbi:MAG: hypothetical protein V5A88_10245, partial [Candidatus Thermoplasmatota archaeon]
IISGQTITFYATSYDECGYELGDVTGDTNWSIEEGAGGEWDNNNVYISEVTGTWNVTANYTYDGEELRAETTLTVVPGEHTLTIVIEGEGSTEPEEGTHTYEPGEEVVVSAVPDDQWYFVEWTGDYESTDDEITIIMDEDKNLTAHFEEEVNMTELTVHMQGNGTVEVDGEPVDDGWTGEAEEGTEMNLTAAPQEGWYFDGWTGDHESGDYDITVTMDSDKILTAHFEKVEEDECVLTINRDGEGTTQPEPGDHIYEEGEEVTVNAIPEEGWVFDGWTGNISGVDEKEETLNITMDSDKEITAHFEEAVGEALFELEILTYDEEVEIGEEISMIFSVENTGSVEDTQEILFRVSGVNMDVVEVTLGPGEHYTDNFSMNVTEARFGDGGEFEFEVIGEDQTESVSVAVVQASEAAEEGGFFATYWWLLLIVLVVAGVLVLILLVGGKDRSEKDHEEQSSQQSRVELDRKEQSYELDEEVDEGSQSQVPGKTMSPDESVSVHESSGSVSTAFREMGKADKEGAFEYLTKEKGLQMDYGEFEEEVDRLVRKEKLVREVQKDGADLYEWVGE